MKKIKNDANYLLRFLPIGMERPRPLKELVKLTGWKNRKVRNVITRLITEYEIPIGANYQAPYNGYFIIADDNERAKALAPLLSQIGEMSKRINTISTADLSVNKKAVTAERLPHQPA